MKGASEAIRKAFDSAGNEMEELADKLEEEVDSLARLSSYINTTETEKISDALAEALNIQNLLNDQRTELSGLAKETIRKCDQIVGKFEETVAKKRELDSGMRSILRNMRSLLSQSERKLGEAKDIIKDLRERINKVMATLRVFKGLIQAAKDRDEKLQQDGSAEDAQNIVGAITSSIVNGVDGWGKAEDADKTTSLVANIMAGITKLTASIIKAVNRPDVGPTLDSALKNVNSAIDIVEKQADEMEKEVELIIVWESAIDTVKGDVFGGNLEGGTQQDRDLFEEIQEIIDDGDVADIYAAFNILKDAAQNYLSAIQLSCSTCAQ